MRIVIGFFIISVFITGCVIVNGSINNNHNISETVNNQSFVKEVNTSKEKENVSVSCSLKDYESLLVLPALPSIPDELKSDSIYVEIKLIESIGRHREIVKKLIIELEKCKLTG